ncbi:N-formylglutamate amidohydrolase [Pontibacter cellulosilyticus]|uniref:N-formylglutamate amidohydrolase n=1 Tax=Pontibacter cellulosilyticus TaxID=1720253 RepID=A0A923SPH8_9BACT|nr:N-formylglutamate amidohydrolase [Pontibacter cellulosilyticus]MBC5994165.1 N-formylglutamate amidohydrolase [Pontibacter cellulosilyticus]
MIRTKVDSTYYTIKRGDSPLVATAIHSGHEVRHNISNLFALAAEERLREEDPFTDQWVEITDNQIIGHNSRFELDLNRPRNKAIYRKPEDAWGLNVWKDELAHEFAEESLAHYDRFYADVKQLLKEMQQRHGCFVVYDLHSYNHKREGANGPAADPQQNPEVNIGTGNMDRQKWAPVVDAFTQSLQNYNYHGRHLDVRENVKFEGGHFMRWIHDNFGDSACVMSIEFKKFFMDEWTGQPDHTQIQEIKKALEETTKPVLAAMHQVCRVL